MGIQTRTYSQDKITKININCKIFKIRVVQALNESIELAWKDTVMRSLEIQEDTDGLIIIDHASIGIYGTLALINLKKDAQLLIKLPSSYAGKLVLQTKEESIHISDVSSVAKIGLAASTGEILIENSYIKTLDIRGNAGKINCYSLDTKDSINISSKTGAINCNLLGNENEYTLSCSTPNRRSDMNGVSGNGAKKVLLTSEHGEIHYSFQNGIESLKPSNRYNKRNSFSGW